MWKYLLIAGALFVGCAMAAALGLMPLLVVSVPIPVAVFLVRREAKRAVGLVACMAAAGYAASGQLDATVYLGLLAGVGLVLGLGITRQWTYGWTLTAITAMTTATEVGFTLLNWEQVKAVSAAVCDSVIRMIQQSAEQAGSQAKDLGVENWLRDNFMNLSFGFQFLMLLVGACLTLSLTLTWLRRHASGESTSAERVRGSFIRMRTSEWLVWAVIAVAGLWFLSRWRPEWIPPILLWNTVIGLAAIYWLNGVSILLYAISVLRPNFLIYLALGLLLFSQGFLPMLSCLGLFDTWGDFRRVVDKIDAARKKRQQDINKDDS